MKASITRVLMAEPGLKAKEIASKLGRDRKEVNSYLYKNLDSFRVNNKYCWTICDQDELVIEIDGDCWVDADSFERSLGQAGSPLDCEANKIKFLLHSKCKLLLEAAARLLALSNQLISAEKQVSIDFSSCKQTLSFLDRVGFFDSLDINATVLPYRPKVSRAKHFEGNSVNLVEFGVIEPVSHAAEDLNSNDKLLINKLTDSFVSLTSSRYEGIVSTIFGELIGNIKGHSQTLINGFAALQVYGGKTPHIQTIVSDSGLGIAATLKGSLSENYPDFYRKNINKENFDLYLVQEALTKGRISRHGGSRGLGFETTSKKAMNFNVKLSARQETFSIRVEYKDGQLADIQTRADLTKIHGTHICFDFMIDGT